MTRTVLDKELQELDQQINQLGAMVDEALKNALDALRTGDQARSGMVIEADARVDSLRAAIEEHTIRLLTLQQPLAGMDLRYLTAALSIASDLERIGDGAAGIATIILRMMPLRTEAASQVEVDSHLADGDPGVKPAAAQAAGRQASHRVSEASIMQGILDLGQEARRVLQGTMQAFAQRDAAAARHLWQEDDVVDVRYHLVRHDLMAMLAGAQAIPALQSDPRILQRATYLLWIAHKLERVADHCTNICERIVFIVEGEAAIAERQPE
ncbi:phosphate signaling complex PhoU family protein [Thermogemmatispora sp.]|uniref:phosphate signaling complex PhoU family protein n=1 Tax=Thermogemmatispora sp. TaxID=1968838 RepID=UPI001DF96194|nr:PhoU domain-containing protein [Thermogemmatispora sp.]MBX5448814.1 PhoU family transcriptional regulator [Thermogemmatispora sp.]